MATGLSCLVGRLGASAAHQEILIPSYFLLCSLETVMFSHSVQDLLGNCLHSNHFSNALLPHPACQAAARPVRGEQWV